MSSAVLNRDNAVPTRAIPRRSAVRQPARRRPESGALRYSSHHVALSRVEHPVVEDDVSWRTLVASVLVTVGVLLGLGVVAHAATSVDAGSLSGATEVVQVGSGETLTDVAERVAPQKPARQVIERIMELNAMSGSSIDSGQSLVVPASAQ